MDANKNFAKCLRPSRSRCRRFQTKTDLKAGFPADVLVDVSDGLVHVFDVRLHPLQVVVYDSHGGLLLRIQALQQGVSLIQQELNQGSDVCFDLLLQALLLCLETSSEVKGWGNEQHPLVSLQ